MDARGVPKREEPPWAGLLALLMVCPFAFSARKGHGLSLDFSFYLSLTVAPQVFVRSDLSPPCGLGTGVTVGCCILPAPLPQPLWKPMRQIFPLLDSGGV